MKNILIITLISTFIMGCKSTVSMSLDEKDNAYGQYVIDENLSSKERVDGFKFSGWNSLSDNYLIITAVHKKDYLIETKGRCLNLHNSHDLKLNRTSNSAVYKLGDSISPVGQVAGNCLIKHIYPITSAQTDYLVNIGKPVQNES